MTLDELGNLLDQYALNEDLDGALMLIERPDRWYDDPHWRCVKQHVNPEPVQGWKAEPNAAPGYDPEWSFQLCPECWTLVRLTFPEDVSGPLPAPKAIL